VEGKKFTVIGAAESGFAVSLLLNSRGAKVFVSEKDQIDRVAKEISILEKASVHYETGGHTSKVLDAECIVISPGVPPTIPIIKEAERIGIPIISEIEIASWFCKGKTIAITGSNGKTTTTTLLGKMLTDAGFRTFIGGNISPAFSTIVEETSESSITVLELSSFQLERIPTFKPDIACILNVYRNHLNRYENSMEKYAFAKANIFRNQSATDILIYNADNPWSERLVRNATSVTIPFSLIKQVGTGGFVHEDELTIVWQNEVHSILSHSTMPLKGPHNQQNALAASIAAVVCGANIENIRSTLSSFQGLEHRVEFVRDVNGVRYFNDSKATDVAAVIMALETFIEPVILILGGQDKGNDYSELLDVVRTKVKKIVAIGESSKKISSAFGVVVDVLEASTMEKAVEHASSSAMRGQIVLLSPACASFDWYKNYEERGTHFKRIVGAL